MGKFDTDTDEDLFASEKAPSLSFKKVAEGHWYKGLKVLGSPVIRQQKNFESGDLETWPDGNPKQVVVFKVELDGEERSVWAKKPSSLFKALQEAQAKAGGRIAPGATLDIGWTGSEPNAKNSKLNDVKLYSAVLYPADALAE